MGRICEFLQIPPMLSATTAYSSHTSHDVIPPTLAPQAESSATQDLGVSTHRWVDSQQPTSVSWKHLNLGAFDADTEAADTEVKCSEWTSLSRVQISATPWTIQSMEFSRPEYCSPGDLSQPRYQTQVSCIAGRFFTSWATREDPKATREDTGRHRGSIQLVINTELNCLHEDWGLRDILVILSHVQKEKKSVCKLSVTLPKSISLSRQLALWPTKCSRDGHPGFLSPGLQVPGNFCFAYL